MSDVKETIWSAAPHTLAKHQILREYLVAWLPIMLRKFAHVQYVDGFAGPGIYTEGQPGSPIIALQISIEHRRLKANPPKHGIDLFFIEERSDRYHRLNAEIGRLLQTVKKPSWITYHSLHGSFAVEAAKVLSKGDHAVPRLVFADPFGYDLPMETLTRLMEAISSELFMFFDYADMHRFIEDSSKADAIDRLYASQDWRPLLKLSDNEQRDALLKLYARQLRANCHFNHVWRFELVDGQQRHYFLLFGTRSEEGLRRMKHAYWEVDPERGQYFIDPKHPDQVALFPAVSSVRNLPAILLDQFGGQNVPIENVARFVLNDTDFVDDMHLKRMTLKPMEQATPPQIRVHGRKRTVAGQYPPGTLIEFPLGR